MFNHLGSWGCCNDIGPMVFLFPIPRRLDGSTCLGSHSALPLSKKNVFPRLEGDIFYQQVMAALDGVYLAAK